MTAAIAAVILSTAAMAAKRRISPAFSRSFAALRLTALSLLLAACGDAGLAVKSQVLTPPPSAPRSAFFVEKPDVQSREVGSEAWQRNAEYGGTLTEELRNALSDRGKTLAAPPADIVRSRVYLAYGSAPVKVKDSRRAKAHVEVRLQLIDAANGTVLYSTHTLTPIEDPLLGWGPEVDEIIRAVLRHAAQDFASRL